MSYKTAQRYVEELVEFGVLAEVKKGSRRVFVAKDILDLVEEA